MNQTGRLSCMNYFISVLLIQYAMRFVHFQGQVEYYKDICGKLIKLILVGVWKVFCTAKLQLLLLVKTFS